MSDYKKMSINTRIAICLVYIEKIIPLLEDLIRANEKYKEYLNGKKQVTDFLDSGWEWLSGKGSNFDESEMYEIVNDGMADAKRYGGYGYLDFVMEYYGSTIEEDEHGLLESILEIEYYVMGMLCVRDGERVLPQDLDAFQASTEKSPYDWYINLDDKGYCDYVIKWEKGFFDDSQGIAALLKPEDMRKIEEMKEKLLLISSFEPEDIFGKHVGIEYREYAKS